MTSVKNENQQPKLTIEDDSEDFTVNAECITTASSDTAQQDGKSNEPKPQLTSEQKEMIRKLVQEHDVPMISAIDLALKIVPFSEATDRGSWFSQTYANVGVIPIANHELYGFNTKLKKHVPNLLKASWYFLENNIVRKTSSNLEDNSIAVPDLFLYSKKSGLYSRVDSSIINGFLSKCYEGGVFDKKTGERKPILALGSRSKTELTSALERTLNNPDFSVPVKNINEYGRRYIVCANGVIDRETRELLPYSHEFGAVSKISATYDPNAYCREIDDYLNQISGNSKGETIEEIRMLIEEMIGYTLVDDTQLEKAFLIYGKGSNGKSTLLRVIESLLGSENTSNLQLGELTNAERTTKLVGSKANLTYDMQIQDIKHLDVSPIKTISSGEAVVMRPLYESSYTVNLTTKLIAATNGIPHINGTGDSIARRFVVIPFRGVDISRAKQLEEERRERNRINGVKHLPFIETITTDEAMSYLLNLALDALDRIYENGEFTTHASVKDAISLLNDGGSSINGFIEMYDEDYGGIDGANCAEVYDKYKDWVVEVGLKQMSAIAFNKEVTSILGYTRKSTSKRVPEVQEDGSVKKVKKTVRIWKAPEYA